jgi:hypothetical protein
VEQKKKKKKKYIYIYIYIYLKNTSSKDIFEIANIKKCLAKLLGSIKPKHLLIFGHTALSIKNKQKGSDMRVPPVPADV